MGWKIMAREANWRCCAMESATSLSAAILSASVMSVVVVSGGISLRGSLEMDLSSSTDVMVAREDGWSGGRVREDEGSRRGVEMFEFRVEGGRTRFARRKEKNAINQILSFKVAQGIVYTKCSPEKKYRLQKKISRLGKRGKKAEMSSLLLKEKDRQKLQCTLPNTFHFRSRRKEVIH